MSGYGPKTLDPKNLLEFARGKGASNNTKCGDHEDADPLLDRRGANSRLRRFPRDGSLSIEDGLARRYEGEEGDVHTLVSHEPTTDPFSIVCEYLQMPKYGHQYVIIPARSRHCCCFGGQELSVGPHWGGVLYTISIISFVTLFLDQHVIVDFPSYYRPVSVAASAVVVVFLLATACVDPGIVRESADRRPGLDFCAKCSIWMPEGADHCDECGVCIQDLDHHCPWMGKCVGRGNMLWFKLFNGSWVVFLFFVLVSSVLNHSPTTKDPL